MREEEGISHWFPEPAYGRNALGRIVDCGDEKALRADL